MSIQRKGLGAMGSWGGRKEVSFLLGQICLFGLCSSLGRAWNLDDDDVLKLKALCQMNERKLTPRAETLLLVEVVSWIRVFIHRLCFGKEGGDGAMT